MGVDGGTFGVWRGGTWMVGGGGVEGVPLTT